MKKLILTSPLPPSVNNYLNYRVATNPKTKRKFVQAYPSQETLVYKRFFTDYVKDEIRNQGWIRPEKGKIVYVQISFFLDRKRKDPNNFLKLPFDVLSEAGVYFDDDIALPVGDRIYLDSANPRLEIEIYASEAIGIFENEDHLNQFMEDNCFQCKKNHEKCGVLKRLLDNRIIEESNGNICHKKK